MTKSLKAKGQRLKGPKLYWWQWHGREVHIIAEVCRAPNKTTARAFFRRHFPDTKTVGLFRTGVAKAGEEERL